jgi:hypothetical protein
MFENRQKDRTTDHAQKKKWRELARIVGPALEPAFLWMIAATNFDGQPYPD